MRIEPGLYLVGSGNSGFDLTDAYDCNIYLFDTDDGYVLFDAGAGLDVAQILAVCRQDGVDVSQIRRLFLTHGHGDHAGGGAFLADHLPIELYAGPDTARIVATGDEAAVSLTEAKAGGIYPADYVYRACPVKHALADGETVQAGDMIIQAIATPGHSHDHFSYLVSGRGRRYLVGGDAIFYGGRIVLQNTYDCCVPQSIASIQRLAALDFDALLPGHLNFSLNNGRRHVESACRVIEQMGCPPSIV